MSNNAAWINEKHGTLQTGTADKPSPGPGELLVKVKVIAFSPIESKIQRYGTHPIPYPNILGTAFSGIVEGVGSGVTKFKSGDRIAAVRGPKIADPRFGAYQQYALASAGTSAKLPEGVSLDAGAASIVNLSTIVPALTVFLGVDRPDIAKKSEPKGKKILIYGGSSSCGGLAIPYALAAGYNVVTTSSSRNRQFVESLGPQVIIDHEQAHEQLLGDIRANGPYAAIFDTIGLPPVTDILAEYVHSLGGGSYHTVIPLLGPEKPVPDDVQRQFQPYGSALEKPEWKELKEWFYDEFVPKGLESGLIVPTRSQWVEGGLEKAQEALDLMHENKVSGHKLVLDPWG